MIGGVVVIKSTAASEETVSRYTTGPGIGWVVEENGLLVLDAVNRRELFLPYPEAALWDLLSRHQSLEVVMPVLLAIFKTNSTAYEQWALKEIALWETNGWLVREGADG